jgi:hypothetical protein
MHLLSRQDTQHVCPHPACTVQVPSLIWACAEHWQGLPPEVRQGLWSAARESGPGSLALQSAEQRALSFWGPAAPSELRLAA